MSATDIDGQKHEILIIRHGGHDEHDGHHGGAWKIAFADFMTAMMCFFLVMWLINAANEQTKAAVASYFNPVKLIDRNSSRKGLEDVGEGSNALGSTSTEVTKAKTAEGTEGKATSGPSQEKKSKESSTAATFSDENLFSDPYSVLAEIAADTGRRQNVSTKGEGGAQDAGPATGASGGESYRDPFAPDFWSSEVASPENSEASAETRSAFSPPAAPDAVPSDPATPQPAPAAASPAVAPETASPAKSELERKLEALTGLGRDEAKAAPESDAQVKAAPTEAAAPVTSETAQVREVIAKPDGTPSAAAEKAAADVRKALEEALGAATLKDGVSVSARNTQVVISITDQFENGMFQVGSAVPRRELVKAMEKVAGVLESRAGLVTISGHTDARPYRGEGYDNWRLSTARAHSAYYMLVRGGLAEARVGEVAGFADRKLKVQSDPLADANRRIEILLDTDA